MASGSLTVVIIIAASVVAVSLVLMILVYKCFQKRRRSQRVSQDQAAARAAAKREKAIKAATQEAIKQLPIKRWQKGQYGEECAVCLTNFQPGDELRQLPCGHAFRVNCIDQWLLGKQGNTSTLKQSLPACPLCKEPLIKEPTDGEGVTHLGVSGGTQMREISRGMA